MEPSKNKRIFEKLTTLVIGLLAIMLVLGSYGFLRYYINRPDRPKVDPIITKDQIDAIKNQNQEIFKEYQNSQKVDIYPNGLVTPKSLISACSVNGQDGTCGKEIASITKNIVATKNIQKAYLYVKVGVSRDGKPFGPLTQYDSVWFYIDSNTTGGHLLRSKAISNRQTDDGVTELLFDLSNVPFVKLPYSDASEPKIVNLLDVLKNKDGHIIGSFVSTLGDGKIYEMKIGYIGGSIQVSN